MLRLAPDFHDRRIALQTVRVGLSDGFHWNDLFTTAAEVYPTVRSRLLRGIRCPLAE